MSSRAAPTIIDAVLWRRRDVPGHDCCTLARAREGFVLSGVAVFLHRRSACCLQYRVVCDGQWMTRSATVKGNAGRRLVDVQIRRTKRGWVCNGRLHPELADCVDVDLSFTPATNTLPVRRLRLAVGESAEVDAAWLRFPSFTLTRIDQTYQNLGRGKFAYRAYGGRFRRQLSMRPCALIEIYPNLWSREHSS